MSRPVYPGESEAADGHFSVAIRLFLEKMFHKRV